MRKIMFLLCLSSIVIMNAQILMRFASDLFISEYVEGSSNNKAIEIYNGTGETVNLSQYSVKLAENGEGWDDSLALSGSLANNDVYIIMNTAFNDSYVNLADSHQTIPYFTGDDAIGLFKNSVMIDVIGNPNSDPGYGWEVSGVSDATKNHTLVRKSFINTGNIDWNESAGMNASDSEWIVYPLNTFTYLGSHDFDEVEESSISDIQQGNVTGNVSLSGIVTAISSGSYDGYCISSSEGGEWNGISVSDGSNTPNMGDNISLNAEVNEDNLFTQLINVSNFRVNSVNNEIPEPVVVTPIALNDEKYESVLVKLEDVTVQSVADEYGRWIVSDGVNQAFIHNRFYNGSINFSQMGTVYDYIIGIVDYSYNEFGLNPRAASDFHEEQIPQVATPVLTPEPGNYDVEIEVSITCATPEAVIYYTVNGDNPDQNSTLYTTPINITQATTIKTIAYKTDLLESEVVSGDYSINEVISLDNIAQLRLGNSNGTKYILSNEVFVTHIQNYQNQKWVQDNSGAIILQDPNGIIEEVYEVGDGLTNLKGVLDSDNDVLKFNIIEDNATITSNNNNIVPLSISLSELVNNTDAYQSRLISFNARFLSEGSFSPNSNYDIVGIGDDTNVSFVFYTGLYGVDYIYSDIPQGEKNFVVLVGHKSNYDYVVARKLSDIMGNVENQTNENMVDGIIRIKSNYPNPFNPTTTIKYYSSKNKNINIYIYNIKGQIVRGFKNIKCNIGDNLLVWNGENDNGQKLSSGVYFAKISNNKIDKLHKMVLLK